MRAQPLLCGERYSSRLSETKTIILTTTSLTRHKSNYDNISFTPGGKTFKLIPSFI